MRSTSLDLQLCFARCPFTFLIESGYDLVPAPTFEIGDSRMLKLLMTSVGRSLLTVDIIPSLIIALQSNGYDLHIRPVPTYLLFFACV